MTLLLLLLLLQVAVIGGHHSSGSNGQQQQKVQHSLATRKVGQMCATIASVFTVCWTPFQVLIVVQYTGMQYVLNYLEATFLLPAFNSCVNPIIYGFMYKPFRQGLQQVGYFFMLYPLICVIVMYRRKHDRSLITALCQ